MKLIRKVLVVIAAVYVLICIGVFAFQEKLLFFPTHLEKDYKFNFGHSCSEVNIPSTSGNVLNALLFPVDSAKGLIIYFHGNGGSLDSWASVSEDFIPEHYSVLIMDYAGYGKSTGRMSEENLFKDAQAVYDFGKTKVSGENMIVYGRSIGTGIAAHLAAENNPRELILEAPYFSMTDLASKLYPFLPSFILRYPLRTDEFLQHVKCPVTIFHGTEDEIIYAGSSEKLKALTKPGDHVYMIKGGHHNDLDQFQEYRNLLTKTLE